MVLKWVTAKQIFCIHQKLIETMVFLWGSYVEIQYLSIFFYMCKKCYELELASGGQGSKITLTSVPVMSVDGHPGNTGHQSGSELASVVMTWRNPCCCNQHQVGLIAIIIIISIGIHPRKEQRDHNFNQSNIFQVCGSIHCIIIIMHALDD
jgi:hypothetical protein